MEQPQAIQETLRAVALGGFLTASTLIIGINFKVFNNIFKENAHKYWWLFLVSAVIPVAVVLFIFSFFFERT
ncbi:hypothetical protein A2V56_04450 [Candidatus Woesebacteria bacterium RBG_19FT_COMBO_42_9]|uniref:Uncharacterized protein n=1 Tax=Candidatus Woesebacteria bacterium RBG_16_42_24 TaxID=1802485 RepID=A0A1F7XLN2_9BACT|nr:MAG: hypothetical protein A2V97_04435 [Candidatus Woesebacteria bacterium RBG_16_42_24]OGM16215.1 MAG: hypothetical protein A2V56_04450 [Candidatus Woesebacteria bacterium RBG_19FT_COMBO_42_9]OGM68502.1 MAG: hypothetical protein A2985_03995 [Candidatus Woesebacteria bacterium RIFCSPLOWO2_01_FULL_43_11]